MRNRRRASDPSSESLAGQVTLGIAVGAIAGGLLAWITGNGPIGMLVSTVGCGLAGLVCGLVIWLGSANLPEHKIVPVRASRPISASRSARGHRLF